jgi:hypothetical protein
MEGYLEYIFGIYLCDGIIVVADRVDLMTPNKEVRLSWLISEFIYEDMRISLYTTPKKE